MFDYYFGLQYFLLFQYPPPLAPCLWLYALQSKKQFCNLVCASGTKPGRNKQLQWQLVTWFMLGIEQAEYKCMCFPKCEVGHSRLVGSAAKDKCNLKWDLYPCIQVAFCHPVTKVSEVTCPFLQCWCCKWSCLRLYIKPHYRYSLAILSSVAEEWGALSLYLVNPYVLQKIFLSYLYPHVFRSSCIIHCWRICISLKLKVPRVHCNDERNGGRSSWLGLFFFWPSTFANSFIVQKSLN